PPPCRAPLLPLPEGRPRLFQAPGDVGRARSLLGTAHSTQQTVRQCVRRVPRIRWRARRRNSFRRRQSLSTTSPRDRSPCATSGAGLEELRLQPLVVEAPLRLFPSSRLPCPDGRSPPRRPSAAARRPP